MLALGCTDGILNSGADFGDTKTSDDSAEDTDIPADTLTDSEPVSTETDSTQTFSCGDAGLYLPEFGTICWYIGLPNQSCTNLCAEHGGLHPDAPSLIGTAEQGGSSYVCGIILFNLSLYGIPIELSSPTGQGLGCYRYYDTFNNSYFNSWVTDLAFDPDQAAINTQRICGCTGVSI